MRPAIEVLRSQQAAYMTETGLVQRETGETYFDDETGTTVPVVETVYDGPILIRPRTEVRTEEAGGTTYVVGKYDVTFPADTPVVRGDVVKVTSSPYDAALVGTELHLLDVPLDAWQVARYCVAERFA